MATCRFSGTTNCDGNASNYAEGDIVYGSNGNLFECVDVAGCSHTTVPTVGSTEWEPLLGGDSTVANSGTASRMEITSDKIEIYNAGTLRVILGNLT